MNKFFYFFLCNLVLFSGGHDSRAHSLDPRTLDTIDFGIYKSQLNGIDNSDLYKNPDNSNSDEKRKSDSKRENVMKTMSMFYPHNFQKYPFPANNIGVVEMTSDDSKTSEFTDKVFPKTVTRRKNDFELDACRKAIQLRKREKEVFSRVRPPTPGKKVKRYLDYTNSQMPFNEGSPRYKSSKDTKSADKSQEAENEGNRKGRSTNTRLLDFKRLLDGNFDLSADDAILEYSRVRRFLDHERAKKRVRTSTLESKEAAMSRVLDPNLNLDGILEPHVRKRRGRFTRKRDLSSRTRRNKIFKAKESNNIMDY